VLNSSSSLLFWIHSLSPHLIFLPPSIFIPPFHPPPLHGGVYSAILLGSMHINPFSMNNILIQSGISSNNLLLGTDCKLSFNTTKRLLHSTTNSTIYPSFTHFKPEINGSGPLIIQIFQPSYCFLVPNQWFLGSPHRVNLCLSLYPFMQ
jgi:hypothetical protein